MHLSYNHQYTRNSTLAMKKATMMSYIAVLVVILTDLSEGSVDFFDIVDQTTAEFLQGYRKGLHRSSSAAAISAPRNNKYLEASMQIIRGKIRELSVKCI